MEMAKVTSKGQITIPVSIRRRLNIKEGDRLLFIDRPEGVMMVNPDYLPKNDTEAAQYDTSAASSENVVSVMEESPEIAIKSPISKKAIAQAEARPVRKTDLASEKAKAKTGVKVNGLDIDALLNEIRSIGSNI